MTPIDWDSFFRNLVIDGNIAPSEITKLTPARLIAILTDPETKKPQPLDHSTTLEYVREYQRKHFGRKI